MFAVFADFVIINFQLVHDSNPDKDNRFWFVTQNSYKFRY